MWRRGSVVGSWLLDLTAEALHADPGLEQFTGRVSDSGEGRWTSIAAIEEGCRLPLLTAALYSRFASRGSELFADKVQFGAAAGVRGSRREAPFVNELGDRLRRLEAVTDAGLAQLDVEELLDELLDRVRELLAVDTAAVLLLDPSAPLPRRHRRPGHRGGGPPGRADPARAGASPAASPRRSGP